jgi:hypothetical protein
LVAVGDDPLGFGDPGQLVLVLAVVRGIDERLNRVGP